MQPIHAYSLSLVLTATAGPPSDDLNLLVPARDALIIIGAVLGALILLLLLLVLCCCCWTMQLRCLTIIVLLYEALLYNNYVRLDLQVVLVRLLQLPNAHKSFIQITTGDV